MTELAALLELASDLAAEAAGLSLERLGHERSRVRTKSSATDMVSEVDEACERLIVAGIERARPGDGILSEEGASAETTTGVRWVIDPIDGTTNYLYGHPGYAISIAAEVAEMHPQTLRMYEARGLITPKRSPKNTRLYSYEDVERLRRIQQMTAEEGLNLAGVESVLSARARARAGARREVGEGARARRRAGSARWSAELERVRADAARRRSSPTGSTRRVWGGEGSQRVNVPDVAQAQVRRAKGFRRGCRAATPRSRSRR